MLFIHLLRVAQEQAVLHDYCDGPYEPSRRYDLIWCAEFVEHVEDRYVANFLRTFTFADKYVAMTYALPGQGGHNHVNERSELYWLEKISSIGFAIDWTLTEKARSLVPESRVVGKHFRGKGLVFKRTNPRPS